jgi:hypothetical protein
MDASDGRRNTNGAYGGRAARDLRAMILPPRPPTNYTLLGTVILCKYSFHQATSRIILLYVEYLCVEARASDFLLARARKYQKVSQRQREDDICGDANNQQLTPLHPVPTLSHRKRKTQRNTNTSIMPGGSGGGGGGGVGPFGRTLSFPAITECDDGTMCENSSPCVAHPMKESK